MENLSNEIWKDIEGFETLYKVSNLGRIKSLPKKVSNWRGTGIRKEKILKERVNRDGYAYINLRTFKNPKSFMIHRLVAKAFISTIIDKDIVNHINFIKHDNRVENLEWCTQRENLLHSKENMRQSILRRKSNKKSHP